jgi:hypothetical protein
MTERTGRPFPGHEGMRKGRQSMTERTGRPFPGHEGMRKEGTA